MNGELFESVSRVRIVDSVVMRIQDLILANQLRPGDALPSERALASRLSISRNVLREALGVLGQKGLVTARHGRGTVVAEPSTDQTRDSLQLLLQLRHVSLSELCDARLLIEPELAALAAEHATTSDTSRLTMWMERLRSTSDDARAHVDADLGFHGEIAAMAQHSVFGVIVDAVRQPVTHSMMFGTSVPRAIDHSDEHHEAVCKAILRGDSTAARHEMRAHILYVTEYVRTHEVKVVPYGVERRG